jgi:homoserine O-succinyltransferase
MPLVINGGRVPDHWARREPAAGPSTSEQQIRGEEQSRDERKPTSRNGASVAKSGLGNVRRINIALINNMPDAALEDTEAQFFSLLEAAAGELPVDVQLFYLPDVPRGDRVQEHLGRFYLPATELWNHPFDGAIITGTEPRQPNLRDEPYWDTLASVFDWAEQHTASAILSCLAAHASVLHSDGIERTPLGDKQFGVFEYRRIGEHAVTEGLPQMVRFPHSRWNEIRASALIEHEYELLDQSCDAGVNLFIKNKGRSLFVHFQGHPEYRSRTLLKEYRRDIRRFLKQERATFPSMPHGYFDTAASELLVDFRKTAEAHPVEETFSSFPEARLADTLRNTWHSSAAHMYRNWLQYMLSKNATVSPNSSLSPAVRA